MTHENEIVTETERSHIIAEEDALMDFQFAVLDALEARGWTRAELARAMNVSAARVSQILSPDANPTVKMMGRVYDALGLRLSIKGAEKKAQNPAVAAMTREKGQRSWVAAADAIRIDVSWQMASLSAMSVSRRVSHSSNDNYADAGLLDRVAV